MMSDLIMCGPCGYAENDNEAKKWCTVCEEGLCKDCEKVHKSIKTTRNHRLISTDDFRQIQDISISLKCEDHDKRLELYCKTHDVAVCLGCVCHRACSDVIPLDEAAENAQKSTTLADLENTLLKTLQSLQQIITDRESALKNLDDQKQSITITINLTRERIMKKLDSLEQKLLLELYTQNSKCKSEVRTFLNRLKNSEHELSCLKDQTFQLKSCATEIQLFLGTHQMNEAFSKEVESVQEVTNSIQNSEVVLQLHPAIVTLMNEVDQLGKISVKKTTISLPFKETKIDQVQTQLHTPVTEIIKTVRIQLKKRFNVMLESYEMRLTGCTILSNGNLLIADYYGKNAIREYSEDGKHIRDIQCIKQPYDLTVVHSGRVAVTYGNSQYLEIININNNAVVQKVQFYDCFGISCQNTNLFIVVRGGIVITDFSVKVLRKLKIEHGSYLETTADRIYFTVKRDQTVNCISMTGEEIWVHKVESLVQPRGITVDDNQNVFVADEKSSSLIVIQHDGRVSRTLLTKKDGVYNPIALHYNKQNNALLLCNGRESTALYNLE